MMFLLLIYPKCGSCLLVCCIKANIPVTADLYTFQGYMVAAEIPHETMIGQLWRLVLLPTGFQCQ